MLNTLIHFFFLLDTFQVQRLSIGEFQSKDCATCIFAEETTATGCHIRFVDTTGNTTAKEIDAPRPEGTLSAIGCVGDLPPGVYRVLAYEISSSGVVDDRVAVVGESLITVTVKLTTDALSITQSPSMRGTGTTLPPNFTCKVECCFSCSVTSLNHIASNINDNDGAWIPQRLHKLTCYH